MHSNLNFHPSLCAGSHSTDTLVTYMLDTYHGSSGAPVLLATDDGKLELVAVHRKFSRASGVCKIGSIPNEDFLSRL